MPGTLSQQFLSPQQRCVCVGERGEDRGGGGGHLSSSSLQCKLVKTGSDGLSPKRLAVHNKVAFVFTHSNLGQWHLLGTGHGARRARPPRQARAHVAVHGPAGAFAPPAAPGAESPPRVQGLSGPDPHPGRDAHQKAHEVLQHKNCIVRTPAVPLQ